MNRNLILITILLLSLTSFADTAIGSCAYTISSAGNYYVSGNLACTADAITVSADNVKLDLNGKTVDGDDGTGDQCVQSTGYKNITVINGTCTDFGNALRMNNINNSIFANMTFQSGSANSIYLGTTSLNDSFSNINITNTANGGGLWALNTASNMSFNLVNTINASDSCYNLASTNVNFTFTNSLARNCTAYQGFMITGGSGHILDNITTSYSPEGIRITGSTVTIQNSLIENNTDDSIHIGDDASSNVTMINNTISRGDEGITASAYALYMNNNTFKNQVSKGISLWGTNLTLGSINNTKIYNTSNYIDQTTGHNFTFNNLFLGNDSTHGITWPTIVINATDIVEDSNAYIHNNFVSINTGTLTDFADINATVTQLTDTPCTFNQVFFQYGFPTTREQALGGTNTQNATCISGEASFNVTEFSGYALGLMTGSINITFNNNTNATLFFEDAGDVFTNVTYINANLIGYPEGITKVQFNTYQKYDFYNDGVSEVTDSLYLITRNFTGNIRVIDVGTGVISEALVKLYYLNNETWVKYHQEYSNAEGYLYPPIITPGNPIKIVVDKDGYTETVFLDDTANLNGIEYVCRIGSGSYVFTDGVLIVPQYSGNTYNSNFTNFSWYVASQNPQIFTIEEWQEGVLNETTVTLSEESFIFTIDQINESDNFTIIIFDENNNTLLNSTFRKTTRTTVTQTLDIYMDRTPFFFMIIAIIFISAGAEFFLLKGMEAFFGLCIMFSLLNIYFVPLMVCGLIYWYCRSAKIYYGGEN